MVVASLIHVIVQANFFSNGLVFSDCFLYQFPIANTSVDNRPISIYQPSIKRLYKSEETGKTIAQSRSVEQPELKRKRMDYDVK